VGVRSFELDAGGRSVIAAGSCDASGATTTVNISYFDDSNAVVRTATTSGPGCMAASVALKVLVDTNGLTLIILPSFKSAPFGGVPPGNFAARWLDASGNALTDWFAAGALTDIGFLTQPLIGGGIAVSSDGNTWNFIPSGEARIAPSPAVLNLGQLTIVLGGRAYAVQSDTLKALIAPTGEVCAQLPPMNAATAQGSLTFGRDGTVAAAQLHFVDDLNSTCSVAWYPGLLK
ncbi:MAG TPA: hypothetical protein VH083_21100, partial [Myxococcales bacterium]|nr:hypothetical protein [Myxococcales bacterium]